MTERDQEHRLTMKQESFVTSYLSNGFNATKAAIAAGYAEKSAHVQGSRLLRNDKVAEVIRKELDSRGITPAKCEMRLAEVAFGADLADFDEWLEGEKTLAELNDEGVNTSVVKACRVTPSGRSIELHSRLNALIQLARILSMHKDGRGPHHEVGPDPRLSQMTDEELEREAHAVGIDESSGEESPEPPSSN